jgi:glycopeptide antibiotics resistance protein
MARGGRIRRGRAWLFLVLWIALTGFTLSVKIDRKPAFLERGGDKVVHVALFTVMGTLAQAAAPWASLLVTVPVGVGLEQAQRLMKWRIYSEIDMLANLCGALLGLACFELSQRLVK